MKRALLGIALGAALAAGFAAAQEAKENPSLERLKKLAGDWASEDGKAAVTYRVTAGGSAVVETLFPGTPHEMVTVYTGYGENGVRLTHYCMLGNQPTMRIRGLTTTPETMLFECEGREVGGAKSHDEMHMHAVLITFVDDDHLKHAWTTFKDGKPHGEPHELSFARKK
jgi:hypothetical protein